MDDILLSIVVCVMAGYWTFAFLHLKYESEKQREFFDEINRIKKDSESYISGLRITEGLGNEKQSD